MKTILRIAGIPFALGLLALMIAVFMGDQVDERRLPLIVLAIAGLIWFARPAAAITVALLIPLGAIIDAPFLTQGRGIYATEVLLIGAFVWYIIRYAINPDLTRRPFGIPVFFYMAFLFLSLNALLFRHTSLLSSHEGLRPLRVLILAMVVIDLFRKLSPTPIDRNRVLRFWSLGAVGGLALISLGALVEYFLLGGAAAGEEPGSFYRGSVGVAVHIALFSPLALGLALGSSARPWRILGIVAWFTSVVCLPLTASRGAMASVMITSVLVAVLSLRRRGKLSWRGPVLIALVLGVGLTTLALKPELAGESFAYKFNKTLEGDFFSTRADAWHEAREAIVAHPFNGEHPGAESKSIPLELARRHGIPALIAFLGAVITAIWLLLRRRFDVEHENHSIEKGSIALGVAIGLIGLMLVGLSESGIGARTTPLVSSVIAIASLLLVRDGASMEGQNRAE